MTLPLSTAYAPLPHKPHALSAAYCPEWPQYRAAFMNTYRAQFERGQAPCEHCGTTEVELERLREGRMNCSHGSHNPDERDGFQFLCPRCHRAHDKAHQSSASAITLICEGRMVAERLRVRLADLSEAVTRLGLPGITPGGADLVTLLALHGRGGQTEAELLAQVREVLEPLRAAPGPELQAVVRAALKRLKLRNVPVIVQGRCTGSAGPLVWYAQGLFGARLIGPLTLPEHITAPPPSLWEAADREYRARRQFRR